MNDETKAKKAFAEKLLTCPSEPFKAAIFVCPDDMVRALRIANEWPKDETVKRFMNDILKDGVANDGDEIKKQVLREALARMRNVPFKDPQGYAKIFAEYAKASGWYKTDQIVDNSSSNRVMIVRESESEKEWEAQLRKQQDELVQAHKH